MILKTKLLGHVYEFKSVKDALAKANEEKSGDRLAGIAAENAEERVAAKVVVANLTLADLRANPAVPYEEDEVTRIIQDDVNEKIYEEIRNWTVAELREWLLDEKNGGDAIRRVSRGLTAEMIAAVAELMSNLDLIYAAKKSASPPTATPPSACLVPCPAASSPTIPPTIPTASWPPCWRASPSARGTRCWALTRWTTVWRASGGCWTGSRRSRPAGTSPPRSACWPT